jgi:hypothetical protein
VGELEKRTCNPVEQEENHKNAYAGRGQETIWEMSDYDFHAFMAAHQTWGAVSKVAFRVVCVLVSVTALILALRGRLPGTRIRHDPSA